MLGDDFVQQRAVRTLQLVGVEPVFLVEVNELAGHQYQSVLLVQGKADEGLDKTTYPFGRGPGTLHAALGRDQQV
ncbi:hypothetical protein D3C75_1347330 [compost metagenome]